MSGGFPFHMKNKEHAHEGSESKHEKHHEGASHDSGSSKTGKSKPEKHSMDLKEYEELTSKLRDLEGLRNKMLSTAAEFENSKKRLAREREEFVKFSQETLIRELISILDNFERALDHAAEVEDPKAKGVVTGVQLVYKQVLEILKNQGLVRLVTVGQNFDPHLHEAVGYVAEEGKEDEIIEEIAPGYKLHDKLLRAAKVRVRVAPNASAENEKDETIT